MKYRKTITLKDGRTCVLRSGTERDGQANLALFCLTHQQTDYLLSYPDEITYTVEEAEAKGMETTSEGESGTISTEGATAAFTNTAVVELPSTGGMGTTIFYILGSILAIGAGIVLVIRKRMGF